MVEIIYNGFNCKYSDRITTLSFVYVISERIRKNTELKQREIQLDSLSETLRERLRAKVTELMRDFAIKFRHRLCFSLSMIFGR
jgi:hypothetical protein